MNIGVYGHNGGTLGNESKGVPDPLGEQIVSQTREM
jgi:hypothetical protein